MFRRRFGRRSFGGRFRRGFKPYPKARQKREYVTLFTDEYGNDPPSQVFTFPTGPFGAWAIATPTGGAGQQGLPRGGQQMQTSVNLPRSQHHGFTGFIPLWSWEYYEYFGHDVTMKSLKGYLMPQAVQIRGNTTPSLLNSGTIVKVRLALMALETAPPAINYGFGTVGLDSTGIANGAVNAAAVGAQSPVPRLNIFSFEDFDHHRMFWWNDWFVPVNGGTWQYWKGNVASPAAKDLGGNEAAFAGLWRSNRIKLGRRGAGVLRVNKDRWLWLVVGLAGASAFTGGSPPMEVASGTGNGAITLDPTAIWQVFINGHIRAFITQ